METGQGHQINILADADGEVLDLVYLQEPRWMTYFYV